MIVERVTKSGEIRYQVRVWLGEDHLRWKTVGTFSSKENAEREDRLNRPPKRRRCDGCPTLFRPKDHRRVYCDRCIIKRSPPKRDDHWVYRCFDADGQLLYVGITSAGVRRFREHGNGRSWWPDTARIEIEHVESREHALKRELELIHELAPPFNSVGKR